MLACVCDYMHAPNQALIGELVHGDVPVLLAWAEDAVWEMRLVDRIGEILRLEAKSIHVCDTCVWCAHVVGMKGVFECECVSNCVCKQKNIVCDEESNAILHSRKERNGLCKQFAMYANISASGT